MKRSLLLASILAFAAPAVHAMECVQLEVLDGYPLVWKCLGIPALTHPKAYWQGYGMTVRPYGGFTLHDPVSRTRCDYTILGTTWVKWQTYLDGTGFDGEPATIKEPRDIRFFTYCPCEALSRSVWSGK